MTIQSIIEEIRDGRLANPIKTRRTVTLRYKKRFWRCYVSEHPTQTSRL